MSTKHTTLSGLPDGVNAAKVQPSWWNEQHTDAGRYDVTMPAYGALGNGTTNDYAAIMAAWNAMPDDPFGGKSGILYFPPGVYAYDTPLVLYGSNFRIVCEDAVLYFRGAGICLSMDGTAASYVFGGGMENVHIRGNVNATKGLRVHNSHHGRYVNVMVEDVTTTALEVENSVCNHFENFRCSHNEVTQSPTPVTGIDLRTGNCSANKFTNPIIEGVSGNGIEINGGVQNVFKGGTSEGNGGWGLQVISGGKNSFEGLDCEVNTTGDFDLSGGDGNVLLLCLGSSLQTYGGLKDTGGYSNVAIACSFHNITASAAAHGLALINCTYSNNGGGGNAGTYANDCADGTVFGVLNAFSAAKEPIQFGRLDAGQVLGWDDGAGATDVTLYRNAAGSLRIGGALVIDGYLTVSGAIAQLVNIFAGAGSVIGWNGRGRIESPVDAAFMFTNAAGAGSPKLRFGSTITQPALRNTGAELQVTDIGETGYAPFRCAALTTNGGVQTFGANDSGGVGYRLVRVPNA